MKKTSPAIAKNDKALKTVLSKEDANILLNTLLNPRISDAAKIELFKTTYHVDAVHCENGETLLILACQTSGLHHLVKLLIKAGADVNKVAPSGKYPLYFGTQAGKEMTQLLVEAGAIIDYAPDKEPFNLTPLTLSVLANNYASFIYLILKGANINFISSNGGSPLYVAAQQKEIKFLVQLLRQKGIIIDNPDVDGNTPLLTAVDRRNPEAVKLLLQAGANINHQNKGGGTVFHMAATNGDEAIVKLLLEHKLKHPETNIEMRDGQGNTPLQIAVCNRLVLHTQLFLEAGASANTQNNDKQSPLFCMIGQTQGLAFDRTQRTLFDLLIRYHADLEQINNYGEGRHTVLSLAAIMGKTGIAILLLEHGANPIQEVQEVIKLGQETLGDNPGMIVQKRTVKMTPLHIAVSVNSSIVEAILLRCKIIDVVDENKVTPLFQACMMQDPQLITLLLDAGADPSIPNELGETSFYMSCLRGTVEQVCLFFSPNRKKSDINAKTLQGFTPLHAAAEQGRMDIVKLLCQKGAVVNEVSQDGSTPLFMAAQEGHHEVVKFLLSQGADAEMRRKDGSSPLGVAYRYKHLQVVRELIEGFYYKNEDIHARVNLEAISGLLHDDGSGYICAAVTYSSKPAAALAPSTTTTYFNESSENKMQSAYSFLKERGFSQKEIEEMKTRNKAKRAAALPVSLSSNTSTSKEKEEVTESKNSNRVVSTKISEIKSEPLLSKDSSPEKAQTDEKASNALLPTVPAAAVPTISPSLEKTALASGKVEIVHHGRINVDLTSLRKPSAHAAVPSPVERPANSTISKPRLYSDPANDPSLINQILQEAMALSQELKPEMRHVNPLYTSNDIDRLSLRFDTYQMFHKIYLLADNAYKDIVRVQPDHILANSLKSFCDIVRKFRSMMIHRPNYVDYSFEEEVKQLILNAGFISWCTELREHANHLVAAGGKPTSDAIGAELRQVFSALSNRILALKSYQQLKDNQDNQISYDECYEQLLFAIKLLAFNEEKIEIQEPPYYKVRRQKASSMLATIIDEYGFFAQVHLSPADFEKLKSTPLYQVAIACKMKYGSSRASFLDACHQFRNKKVSHLAEQSTKSEKVLPTMDATPEIDKLQKHAKKVCEELGIKHINDSIKVVATSSQRLPILKTTDTSSHEKILSSLKSSDAPTSASDKPKLNPHAPEFKPLWKPAAPIVNSSSSLRSLPRIQEPMHNEKVMEVVTNLSAANGEEIGVQQVHPHTP